MSEQQAQWRILALEVTRAIDAVAAKGVPRERLTSVDIPLKRVKRLDMRPPERIAGVHYHVCKDVAANEIRVIDTQAILAPSAQWRHTVRDGVVVRWRPPVQAPIAYPRLPWDRRLSDSTRRLMDTVRQRRGLRWVAWKARRAMAALWQWCRARNAQTEDVPAIRDEETARRHSLRHLRSSDGAHRKDDGERR